MKMSAIAALLAAAIGTTSFVPAAFAQQSDDVTIETVHFRPDRMVRIERDSPGELLDLVCSDNGAERLEIAFVRLSHRLDITTTQQPLFDALKATALTAQTSFADTCTAARPAKDGTAAPDLVDRMKTRIAIDTARLEALNAVLPDFEAFYASLTDAQKALLMPEHEGRDGRMMRREFRDMGPGRDSRDMGPGRTERGPEPGR
ncbi:MAG: Spy/CpxP family protein refolding chaperone [Devosia sp.]